MTDDRKVIHILVIDDEEDHCDIIEECLRSNEAHAFAFDRAHTVSDACILLEKNRYDCVLLDHMLPDGVGCDVLERAEPRLLTTPVIGLSTSCDAEVALAEFRGGCVDFMPKREAFKSCALEQGVLAAIAKYEQRAIASILERRKLDRAYTENQSEMIRSARTDRLMDICNRAAFDDYHADLHKRTYETSSTYGLFLCDVDHFKPYNDRYGHPAGDDILRAVAKALKDALRGHDFIARYGGDEIVILCEGINTEIGSMIAERLRQAVHRLAITHDGDDGRDRVTISLGAAIFRRSTTQTQAEVLASADRALYEAKQKHGRNHCVLVP